MAHAEALKPIIRPREDSIAFFLRIGWIPLVPLFALGGLLSVVHGRSPIGQHIGKRLARSV